MANEPGKENFRSAEMAVAVIGAFSLLLFLLAVLTR